LIPLDGVTEGLIATLGEALEALIADLDRLEDPHQVSAIDPEFELVLRMRDLDGPVPLLIATGSAKMVMPIKSFRGE